ncbi:MAG: GNAT family N-acetyltransferase [Caldilineaceae bacterium]|nr:GNAT family N-acetyltransferase [Caldilineaceae bacterium]
MNAAPAPRSTFQPLTTERLLIRRFLATDLPALLAIRTDPELRRFQAWDAMDEAAIRRFLESMAAAEPGVAGEWFQFAITLRTSGELIGDCGLHLLAEDPRQAEIGYTLSRQFQGQGLAKEALRAILTYMFQRHQVHRIAAITDVRNRGSIKLLERLNFRREGRTHQAFWNKGEWVDEYLYAMTASRWETLRENRARTRTKQETATKAVLLGTGTPNPDPYRHGSAVAVVVQRNEEGKQSQGQAYLVDAGPGVVRRAADAAERGTPALAMPGLTRLFLTHLHSDHIAGLSDLILSPWVLERNETLVIYGPQGTKALVDHLLAAHGEDIRERREGLEPSNDQGYRVEVHEYEAGQIYRDDFVQVEAFRVEHGTWPAFGFRFTTGDRTVVISGDTRPFDGLVEHYRECDLLIHEVYSAEGFERRPPEWQRYHAAVHTSTQELAALATIAQPGLLVLVHQLFWGVSEEALVAEIRAAYAGPVISGHDLDQF